MDTTLIGSYGAALDAMTPFSGGDTEIDLLNIQIYASVFASNPSLDSPEERRDFRNATGIFQSALQSISQRSGGGSMRYLLAEQLFSEARAQIPPSAKRYPQAGNLIFLRNENGDVLEYGARIKGVLVMVPFTEKTREDLQHRLSRWNYSHWNEYEQIVDHGNALLAQARKRASATMGLSEYQDFGWLATKVLL